MTLRLSYAEWNAKLCSFFFSENQAGQPVTLFADDDALAEIVGVTDTSEAVESLTAAVRSRLGSENSGGLFKPVVMESFAWRRNPTGCPPSLPLLAVAVLAAHNMERAEDVGSNNYYIRFRELLDLPAAGGAPKGYAEAFPALWRGLTWWLDEHNQGRLGVSTIPTAPALSYIGFALSQALFRESDRQRLTHFFQWIQLTPGEEIQEAELITLFRNWVFAGYSVSAGLERAVADGQFAEQLGQILQAAAAKWDGVLRDDSGRKLGHILVTLELFPRPQTGLAAERPSGFPAQGEFTEVTGSRSVSISAVTEEWYGELTVALSRQVLDTGLRLVAEGFTLVYQPHRIVPMRIEPALGRWASVADVVPDEAHWILVREDIRERVGHFLNRYARSGWRERTAGCPDGWVLLGETFIDGPVDRDSVDEDLQRLVPTVRNRPVLQGGLPMPGGSSSYLLGGEPDIWVGTHTRDTRPLDLRVDGERYPLTADRVELRLLGLPEGPHEAWVGPTRIAFTTIETLGVNQPSNAATLVNRLAFDDGRLVPMSLGAVSWDGRAEPGQVSVVGAFCSGDVKGLPAALQPPLFLNRGASQYRLLGARLGEIAAIMEPLHPSWMERLRLHPQFFEIHPPFPVAWTLTRWPTRGWSTLARETLYPEGSGAAVGSSEEITAWREAVLEGVPPPGRDDLERWNAYVGVAREQQLER